MCIFSYLRDSYAFGKCIQAQSMKTRPAREATSYTNIAITRLGLYPCNRITIKVKTGKSWSIRVNKYNYLSLSPSLSFYLSSLPVINRSCFGHQVCNTDVNNCLRQLKTVFRITYRKNYII